MRSLAKMFLAILVGVTLIGPAAASEAIKTRTIKWGHLLSPDHPQSKAVELFARLVSERSGGKLSVQHFPSSQLGNEIQQQSALQSGVQEMMSGATTTLVGMIPEFGVLDFPFLVSTYEEADTVLDGPIGQKLLDRLPKHGFVGLAYFENGFRNITNNRRPIRGPDDIAGLKIRVMQNPIYIDTFKRFGANPVPMAFGELFTAMETGTIDAQENPLGIIWANKFYEVQKYLTITNHSYNTNIVLVSKKFWDDLSSTEQQIIQESAVEAAKHLRQLNRSQIDQFRSNLENTGMVIEELSPQALNSMRAATASIVEEYLAKYDSELAVLVRSELNRIRGN